MKTMRLVVYSVVGLAIIGVILQLVKNPGGFFKSILMMVGFAVLIGALLYYFVFSRGNSQRAKYRKAVKQSKKKYGKNQTNEFKPGLQIRKPHKIEHDTSRAHLRVIKGNKK